MLRANTIFLSGNIPVDAIYSVLTNVSIGSILLPLSLCFVRRKSLTKTKRILFAYLFITLFIEVLSFSFAGKFSGVYSILSEAFHPSERTGRLLYTIFSGKCIACCFALANTFTLLQFFAFSYIYMEEFTDEKIRKLIKWATIAYLVVAFILLVPLGELTKESNIITVLEGFILLAWSITFFSKVLKELNIPELKDDSFIWFNYAVFVYFSVALLLFIPDDYLRTCPRRIFRLLWSFHLIAHISFNILTSISIWKQKSSE